MNDLANPKAGHSIEDVRAVQKVIESELVAGFPEHKDEISALSFPELLKASDANFGEEYTSVMVDRALSLAKASA